MRPPATLSLCALVTSIVTAQSPPPPDPTLDTSGLPPFVKLLPSPEPEPWRAVTQKERFVDYSRLAFGPSAALGATLGAAISQGRNSPREWGQGWEAYGARAGSSYGGLLIGNTIEYGASALLHEDNRYFRSKRTTFKGRLGYVLTSPLMSNSGPDQRRISASAFLGGAGSAAIPLLWSPPSWQGWNKVGLNFLIFYGQQAGMNFAREFMPSIVRHYRSRRKPAAAPTSSR